MISFVCVSNLATIAGPTQDPVFWVALHFGLSWKNLELSKFVLFGLFYVYWFI